MSDTSQKKLENSVTQELNTNRQLYIPPKLEHFDVLNITAHNINFGNDGGGGTSTGS